jgi:hypothetical protein
MDDEAVHCFGRDDVWVGWERALDKVLLPALVEEDVLVGGSEET